MAKKQAAPAVRALHGFYALTPGEASRSKSRQVSDADLKRPVVSGLTIRQPWREIMPSLAVRSINLDFFQRQADRARKAGKPYKLLPMSGNHPVLGRPDFLKNESPWSPRIVAAWVVLCDQIDLAFGADPMFRALHVTAPTFDASAEAHTNGSPGKGYTALGWRNAWIDSIDAAGEALPASVSLIFSTSVQPKAKQFVPAVCDYARSVHGDRMVFEHNALHTKCANNPAHHSFIRQQHAKGSRIGFEQVCAAKWGAQRYGSSDPNGPLRLAISQGATFIDVYPPDLPKVKAWAA